MTDKLDEIVLSLSKEEKKELMDKLEADKIRGLAMDYLEERYPELDNSTKEELADNTVEDMINAKAQSMFGMEDILDDNVREVVDENANDLLENRYR